MDYFLPKHGTLFGLLIKRKVWHWWCATLVCLMLGLYLWCVYFYEPRAEQIEQYHHKIAQLQRTQKATADASRAWQDLATTIDVAHSSLQGTPESDTQSGLVQLVTLVQDAGLQLMACSLGEAKKADGFLEEKVHISLQGSSENIMKFLHTLTAGPLLCTHETVSLVRASESSFVFTDTCTLTTVL